MSNRIIPEMPEFEEYSVADLLKDYAKKNAARSSPPAPTPAEAPRTESRRAAEPRRPAVAPSAQKSSGTASATGNDLFRSSLQEELHRSAARAATARAAETPAAPEAETPSVHVAESPAVIAERSRRAAMSALGETLRQYQQQHPAEPRAPEAPVHRKPEPEPESRPAETAAPAPAAVPAVPPEPVPEPAPAHPRIVVGEDGIITLHYGAPVDGPEPTVEPEEESVGEELPAPEPPKAPKRERRKRAARKPAPEPDVLPEEPVYDEDELRRPSRVPEAERLSFTERFLAPAVRMIATRIARRQMQSQEAANWPEPLDIRETPELTPGKAAKYYTSLLGPLTLRFRIAVGLTVLLAWISLKLPMAGMLRQSLPLQAGVSLILLLAVMITALDVVATGLRQLFDVKPGAEALAAIAAFLSCIDGALVLAGHGDALPFCSVGAASLTAALWGEVLTCRALRRTFRTAAASKSPSVLAVAAEDASLLRSARASTEGIVRRSESQDLCRTVFAAASPFLMGAALLLSILSSLGGNGGYFLHTLSALVSVSASFAAFIGFPLPYAIASRKLRNAGAALAGFEGCSDIGKSGRVVITDEDLFPPGTVRFSEINVAEGVFLGKVVSSTAALLLASGSGVSSLFEELVERRGYRVPPVEQFACHEGGGLSGMIGGESVFVGSAGFMNLMGVRLPQNLQTRNSICTAIGNELVGVFVLDYIPVTSVQEALVTLMRGKSQTVFAIRDFNITPRMIGKLFRLPTDNFNFPSFRERYRISDESADDAPLDAVISRAGMLPMVETAEAARKAYNTCRVSAILSLVGAGIGMIIMFLLCRVGSFDTASAGNVLSFMFLWALPVIILSLGQNR